MTVGSNLEMPNSGGIEEHGILAVLESGEAAEEDLDHRLDEYLALVDRVNPAKNSSEQSLSFDEQHAIAERATAGA